MSLSFSPDCTRLAGAAGNLLVLWDISSGQPVFTLQGYWGAAFSPVGRRLATVHGDSLVTLEADLPGPEDLKKRSVLAAGVGH
jgi:WD40 repeat protein